MRRKVPTRHRRGNSLGITTERTGSVEVYSGISLLTELITGQPDFDAVRGLRTAVFISGYEGSPLGGLDTALARHRRVRAGADIVHVPGVNEELAATSVWGSQTIPRPDARYDGVVGFWYGKAPGLDRAGDALRHANFVGSAPKGGAVALTGDDPSAKSSTLPSASEMTLAELCMPVIFPGSSRDLVDLTRHAVALSRWSGLWVGLKITTDVADGIGAVNLANDQPEITEPVFEFEGSPWRHRQRLVTLPPDSLDSERELLNGRLAAAAAYSAANQINRISGAEDGAWLGIAAAGTSYQSVCQALADLGIPQAELARRGIRLLKVGMLYPLESGAVRRFADGLEAIVVVEEKRPFLETAVRDCLYDLSRRPSVAGKRDTEGRPLIPADGELTADRLRPLLRRILARRIEGLPEATTAPTTVPDGMEITHRVPFFCSGCPHNRSTVAPDGSIIGSGIGCHTMVQFSAEPRRRGLALTQMGGEGAQWIGQEPFSQADHSFQNIGDGTFFHSGTLAIRACVAAGVDITYKLLFNRAVAMTGGQDPTGGKDVPDVTRLLAAEGVKRIIVCAEEPDRFPSDSLWAEGTVVWPRDRLEEAQEELARVKGVTVLVYDQQCAAEARRRRKRGLQPARTMRVFINEAVCEGCGDCGAKSNCLSLHPVDTEYGRKTQVHQASCNEDYTCIDGNCPSFVTVRPRSPRRRRPSDSPATVALRPPDRALLQETLPEPSERILIGDGEYGFYLTGIGGTGVVTVNQIMAVAAGMDGLEVTGLDQTGLSQKAGPVVSHLKLSHAVQHGSRRLSAGHVDCLLGFDLLVAAEAAHLAMLSAGRTVAVVSTTASPTGPMVSDPSVPAPDLERIGTVVDAATSPGRNVFIDAAAMAGELAGDEVGANILLLGAAYQSGVVPISAEAIEKAIEVNGVLVELNRCAFRWGRLIVSDPARVEAARRQRAEENAPKARRADAAEAEAAGIVAARGLRVLGAAVEERVAELIRYQNPALARSYADELAAVLRAEQQVRPSSTELTAAVARGLFKLMAYKDEYEVARLYLAPQFDEALARQFPHGVRMHYRLHPPLMKMLGRDEKISVGPWFRYVFKGLYAMRSVRGRAIDPFGHTKVRRTERSLVHEYRQVMGKATAELSEANFVEAVRLAGLPDMVRGYEEIKLANVERFRRAAAALSNAAP
ncbi:MAG: indolepyruvate ferredoxin oxidoreductase family protein [Acidimicrobiales bacterium]